jgi:hypothetical protein
VARTKQEIDAGAKGITGHGILDPGYRSDPGAGFPWADYLELVKTMGTGNVSGATFTPQRDDDQDEDMPKLMKDKRGQWLEVTAGVGFRNLTALGREWNDLLAGLLDKEKHGLLEPIPRTAKGELDEKAIPILSDSALAQYKEL